MKRDQFYLRVLTFAVALVVVALLLVSCKCPDCEEPTGAAFPMIHPNVTEYGEVDDE